MSENTPAGAECSDGDNAGETTPTDKRPRTGRSGSNTPKHTDSKKQRHSSSGDKRGQNVNLQNPDTSKSKPGTGDTCFDNSGNKHLHGREHSNQDTRNTFFVCMVVAVISSMAVTFVTLQHQEDGEVIKALQKICDGCSTKDEFVYCLRDKFKHTACERKACVVEEMAPDARNDEQKKMPSEEESETFPRKMVADSDEEHVGGQVSKTQWNKDTGIQDKYSPWLEHFERLFLTPDNMTKQLISFLIGDSGLSKHDDNLSTSMMQEWKRDVEKQLENMNDTLKHISKDVTTVFQFVQANMSELKSNISELHTDRQCTSWLLETINMNITSVKNLVRKIGSTISRTAARLEKAKENGKGIRLNVQQLQIENKRTADLIDQIQHTNYSMNLKIRKLYFRQRHYAARLVKMKHTVSVIKKNISKLHSIGENSSLSLWRLENKLTSVSSELDELIGNRAEITERIRNVEHASADIGAIRVSLHQTRSTKDNTVSWMGKMERMIENIQLNFSQLQSDSLHESRLLDIVNTYMTSRNYTIDLPVCDATLLSPLLTTIHSSLKDTKWEVRQVKNDYRYAMRTVELINTTIMSIRSAVKELRADEENTKARVVHIEPVIAGIKLNVSKLWNEGRHNSQAVHILNTNISLIHFEVDQLRKGKERSTAMLEVVNNTVHGIRSNVSTIQKDSKNISDVLDKIHPKITSLDPLLIHLNENHANTTAWLVQVENTVKKMSESVSQFQGRASKMESAFSVVNASIASIVDTVQNLNKHQNNFTSWLERLGDAMTDIHSNLTQIHRDNENRSQMLHTVSINMTSLNNTVIQLLEQLWNSTAWLAKVENVSRENAKNLQNLILVMKVHQYEAEETESQLSSNIATQRFILLILVAAVVLWFAGMFRNHLISGLGTESPPVHSTASRNTSRRSGFRDYALKWTEPPLTAICIISYHSETVNRHAQYTDSIFLNSGQACPRYLPATLHSHTDIEQLPGCKMYLVFVDFNERSVILEDPEKGLGDLRVKTVQTLWKFQGDVTVVYCGDIGSRDLREGELFNRNLTSIYSHTELSQLKNQDRILSIHKNFTEYQKKHLRKVAGVLFNR